MIKVMMFVLGWIACGIAAAGIFNASLYKFHSRGRQGAEDQAYFIIWGLIGGPISLVVAMRDSDFAHSGWSLSTHSCAEPVRPVPY
jgi:hypothetical protein